MWTKDNSKRRLVVATAVVAAVGLGITIAALDDGNARVLAAGRAGRPAVSADTTGAGQSPDVEADEGLGPRAWVRWTELMEGAADHIIEGAESVAHERAVDPAPSGTEEQPAERSPNAGDRQTEDGDAATEVPSQITVTVPHQVTVTLPSYEGGRPPSVTEPTVDRGTPPSVEPGWRTTVDLGTPPSATPPAVVPGEEGTFTPPGVEVS